MADDILDDIDFNKEKISNEEMEIYMGLFIGTRVDYYIHHWGNPRFIAFDFLKMMIGVPWFLFRKMYFFALILTSFIILICGLKNIFFIVPVYGFTYLIFEYGNISVIEIILYCFALFFMVIISGFFYERIYLWYAENRIRKIYKVFFGTPGIVEKIVDEENADDAVYHEFKILLKQKGLPSGFFPTVVLLILLFYLLSRVSTGMNTILTF